MLFMLHIRLIRAIKNFLLTYLAHVKCPSSVYAIQSLITVMLLTPPPAPPSSHRCRRHRLNYKEEKAALAYVTRKRVIKYTNTRTKALVPCCRITVGAVCDLHQMTTNDLVVLPEYVVKQTVCDCFQRTAYTYASFYAMFVFLPNF